MLIDSGGGRRSVIRRSPRVRASDGADGQSCWGARYLLAHPAAPAGDEAGGLDPRPSQHTARSKEGRSPAWPEPRCAMRPPRAAHRRRSGAKASTPSPRDEPGFAPYREPHVTTDTHSNTATPRGGNRVGCARPPHGGEAPHLPPPACSRTPERFRARPGPDMARPGPARRPCSKRPQPEDSGDRPDSC